MHTKGGRMSKWKVEQTREVQCPNPKCPAPHKTVRNGKRGGDQQYRCRGCDRQFAAEGQAQYKQFTAHQIGAAVDKYYSGMSYKQVAEHMEDFQGGYEPSTRSVHSWVKGYTDLARKFLEGKVGPDGTPGTATGKHVKADVSDHWVADELFLRVAGQQMYCWNVMDKDSRYVLAVHLSRHRGTNDAIKVMEKALSNAASPPKKITTDGLGSYVDAIKAVFPKTTQHIVSKGIRTRSTTTCRSGCKAASGRGRKPNVDSKCCEPGRITWTVGCWITTSSRSITRSRARPPPSSLGWTSWSRGMILGAI